MANQIRYINAYDHNRAYGGPEEGGWWFDTGTLLASVPFHTDEQAERIKAVLKIKLEPRFQHPHKYQSDISSVLCEGVLQILEEDEPGHDYPTTHPHY